MAVDSYTLKSELPNGIIILMNHGFKGKQDSFKDTENIIKFKNEFH